MGVCFLCGTTFFGKRTRVCTTITPHSKIPYPEKIAELVGNEVVLNVTPADQMCKNCTSILIHTDKLENDLKHIKNALLSYIQKKYGKWPSDQIVKGIEIVNGNLKAEKQLEKDQHIVPSVLTIAVVITPVQTPLKLLKLQLQQQQQQQHQPQKQHYHQQQQPVTQQESANKTKIYKCGYCTFQSKELGHTRIHMRTHVNKKEPEKPILIQPATKALTQMLQTREHIYRCQACTKSFHSKIKLLDHIRKDHNQSTPSTSREMLKTREHLYRCQVCTKSFHFKIKLLDHIRKDHNQSTPSTLREVRQKKIPLYRCLVCDKSFYYRINLREHIHKTHNSSTSNRERETDAKWKIKPEPTQK
ncbi:zinc finger protein 728-like isoform X2 [Metopolophium dirhodum]|nr:zinc finger protein 728-like isoform X2 [Metopolophium dirhodum]